MQDYFKQWTEASQKSYSLFKELGEIQFNMLNSLSQQQMQAAGIYLESGNKQWQTLSESKDMKSLLAAQPGLFEEVGKKLMGNASSTMEVLNDTKAQVSAWTEKGLQMARNAGADLNKAA